MRQFFRRGARGALLLILALVVTLVPPPSPTSAGEPPPDETTPVGESDSEHHPRLEAALVEIARTAPREPGADDPLVPIEVFPAAAGTNDLAALLTALGAVDVVPLGDMAVAASLPASAVTALGDDPRVGWARTANRPIPEDTAGQGVAAIEAGGWHDAGFTGAGVKVAVIDLGFIGYTTSQSSGDLPAKLHTRSFGCGESVATGTNHGTIVAEVAHEVAPDATLYLLCIASSGTLSLAVDFAISQGVTVINHSVGWLGTDRGDGTGLLAPILQDARDAGILWVNSAGNYARKHWQGDFTDDDPNGIHEFAASDEELEVEADPGDRLRIILRWDDWPTTSKDFDLFLYEAGAVGVDPPAASSESEQSGSQPPVEHIDFVSPSAASYVVQIEWKDGPGGPSEDMDLFVLGADDIAADHRVPARSINDTSGSDIVTSVGAIHHDTEVIEPFSSRGPAIDGDIKPSLAAPDGVSTTAGSFFGTSASAPHTAAAAALITESVPCISPASLHTAVVARTEDKGGPPDPNNDYGEGILKLGAAPDPGDQVTRDAGPDRYATAAEISETRFPCGSNVVYVATGENFPDALSGAAVAGYFGAPVLLVKRDSIPAATADELSRLDPERVIVLGGTAVVSDGVATSLASHGTVERLSAPNRYHTAVEISEHGFPSGASVAVVVTGENFPDALPSGPVATHFGGPVLLTRGDSLPDETRDELERLDPDIIYVVGGPAVVSDDVVAALTGIAATERIAGDNRYETAAEAAEEAFPLDGATASPERPTRVYVATGENFPDAMAGGAPAGFTDGPVLLVRRDSIPTATRDEIVRLGPTRIIIFGGTAAVSTAVEQELEGLV